MPIILFNKPYGVISQFSKHNKHPGLDSFIPEKNFYPAGRLDHDSEGLLILTNESKVQHVLSHPKFKQSKVYWAQVEGEINTAALKAISSGLILKDGPTLPALAAKINKPDIGPRQPPIRFRANIPTSWCELCLSEGRNRQVRRMTAAVGFPTLRLVRYSVAQFTIDTLAPGEWVKIETPDEIKKVARNLNRKIHAKIQRHYTTKKKKFGADKPHPKN